MPIGMLNVLPLVGRGNNRISWIKYLIANAEKIDLLVAGKPPRVFLQGFPPEHNMRSISHATPDQHDRQARFSNPTPVKGGLPGIAGKAWNGLGHCVAAGGFTIRGVDARGCGVSGATPAALQAYEQAIGAFLS